MLDFFGCCRDLRLQMSAGFNDVMHKLNAMGVLATQQHQDIVRELYGVERRLMARLDAQDEKIDTILELLHKIDPTVPAKMVPIHGTPTTNQAPMESQPMGKFSAKIHLIKAGQKKAGPPPAGLAKGAPLPGTDFAIEVGMNSDVTVTVLNNNGDPIDPVGAGAATLVAVSSDPCVVIGPPLVPPANFNEKAVTAGTAKITLTLASTESPKAWSDVVMEWTDTATVDPNDPASFVITRSPATAN